jgi:hypothetical protein
MSTGVNMTPPSLDDGLHASRVTLDGGGRLRVHEPWAVGVIVPIAVAIHIGFKLAVPGRGAAP